MKMHSATNKSIGLHGKVANLLRKYIFWILSVGPIPSHLAFIMDGNRRFAKKENLEEGAGHRAGFSALLSILKYCYELGVKYVTVYAFSIDNFKRHPDEVQKIMDLMLEKTEGLLKEESVVNEYGIRVYFLGNLKLLSEPVRVAAEKVMRATANNTKCLLLICVAYTSFDEIIHAVQESCKDKLNKIEPSNSDKACNGITEEVEGGAITHGVRESCKDETEKSYAMNASQVHNGETKGVEGLEDRNNVILNDIRRFSGDKLDEVQALDAIRTSKSVIPIKESEKMQSDSNIKLVDIEKYMYMAIGPDPDVLIRTSGETRLSNFLLWQTSYCPLYSPDALWPEIGLWHLVWAVLNFQRNHSYLEKKKKQL